MTDPVQLPQIPEPRGNLTALEELVHMPFRIGRVRWFYDVPAGTSWRAGEPWFDQALIVALSGSFEVVLARHSGIRLSRADTGLQVPAGMEWTVHDPSTNSVGLVISSRESRPHVARRIRLEEPGAPALDRESTVDDCRTITLARRREARGSVTEAIPQKDVPFEIPRVYYLYDVPGGAHRGGHAHRRLRQLVLAVSGSFDVVLDDGRRVKSVRLDRAHSGVLVTTGIWRELRDFSSGAICLVLASAPYEEDDYIRDYDDFRREKLPA